MSPRPPAADSNSYPLKQNCREVKRDSLAGTNFGPREQFSEPDPATPRHYHTEEQEDQPDIPRTSPCHVGIKSRSPQTCNRRNRPIVETCAEATQHPYNALDAMVDTMFSTN